MMNNPVDRRKFLKFSAVAGVSGCALLMAANLNKLQAFNYLSNGNEIPDPLKMNYCGYNCPDDCKFLKATKENNLELKKEAYETWKIKEKFGVDFDPDKIFCWGCKTPDKPKGVVINGCQVRKCAIEKGYQACIQCDSLVACEKDLWKNFPDFFNAVKEMQKTYKTAKR
jgi:hypothetical protein